MSNDDRPAQHIIITSTKSVAVSLILTFIFGPLGMFYSTIWGAIIMLVVSLVVFTITLGMGLFLVWPICMIWGALAVVSSNKKLFAQASQ